MTPKAGSGVGDCAAGTPAGLAFDDKHTHWSSGFSRESREKLEEVYKNTPRPSMEFWENNN